MSSAARKRNRADDAEDTNTLSIRTAQGEPLHAEACILRAFSSCARQLPAEAAEWDSGFLHNGQPFSRAAVKTWLTCVTSCMHGAAELDAADVKAQLSTAKGLHAVLTFAHAVGSPPSVAAAACRHLDSLKLVVSLRAPSEPLELQLVHQCGYTMLDDVNYVLSESGSEVVGHFDFPRNEKKCRRQVAEQVGALLHMAHVLKLQPLLDALHDFIFFNSKHYSNILYGVLELVFTRDVESVAFGGTSSSTLSKEAYINSVLTRPCSFGSLEEAGPRALLNPVDGFRMMPYGPGEVEFDAELVRAFGDLSARDSAHVSLELCGPAGMSVRLHTDRAHMVFPAHLVLGKPVVCDDSSADFEAIMRSNVEQPAPAAAP